VNINLNLAVFHFCRYIVTIDGAVHKKHLIAISEGTKIDGVMCVPDLVEPLDAQSDTRKTRLKIVVIFISSLLYSVLSIIACFACSLEQCSCGFFLDSITLSCGNGCASFGAW
jgi:hypothetical protein